MKAIMYFEHEEKLVKDIMRLERLGNKFSERKQWKRWSRAYEARQEKQARLGSYVAYSIDRDMRGKG